MEYKTKPRWTARQVNFLIENAYSMKDQQIADVLGKTLKSVRRKRERYGMKKGHGRGLVGPISDKGSSIVKPAMPNGSGQSDASA